MLRLYKSVRRNNGNIKRTRVMFPDVVTDYICYMMLFTHDTG